MNQINFFNNVFFDEDIKKENSEIYKKKSYEKNFLIFYHIKFIEKFLNELSILLGKKFNDYFFYIYTNNKNELPKSITINHPKKILILISNEMKYIPFDLEKYFFCIFKSSLPYEIRKSKIFPFPLNTISNLYLKKIIPIKKRKFDIFFCGNLNKYRLDLYHALSSNAKIFSKISNKLFYTFLVGLGFKKRFVQRNMSVGVNGKNFIKFTIGLNGEGDGLPYDEYLRLLNDSKVALCPTGYMSTETFRHYEAIKSGCVIISNKLPDTYIFRKAPFVKINNWKEGLMKAEKLIMNTERLEDLQRKSILYHKTNLSEKFMAEYVLKKIRILENIKNYY